MTHQDIVENLGLVCRQKSLGTTGIAHQTFSVNTESRKITMLKLDIFVSFFIDQDVVTNNNYTVPVSSMKLPTHELNGIINQGFWNLKQEEPKYGTNSIPWQLFSRRGTKTSKYGTSRKIRDAWQAYVQEELYFSKMLIHCNLIITRSFIARIRL